VLKQRQWYEEHLKWGAAVRSGALAPDPAGKLNILDENSHATSVNGAQIRVLSSRVPSKSTRQHDAVKIETFTSNSPTRCASADSCSAAIANDWKRRSLCKNTCQWAAAGCRIGIPNIVIEHAVEIVAKFNYRWVEMAYGGCCRGGGGGAFGGRHMGWLMG
jgi:hypothetical protein